MIKQDMTGKTDKQVLGAKEIEFSVFCIENIAEKLGIPGDEVYQMLTAKSDILDHYIIANYEILHTQGKEYIVQDIMDYMKERGVIKEVRKSDGSI